MNDRLAGCPHCGRLPQAEVRDVPTYQGRLFCRCGFSAPWANTITDAEALWNKYAQAPTTVISLLKLFHLIGIAFSFYLQTPNERTCTQLIDTVERALEQASS